MQIDSSAWWYRIPATYNWKLHWGRSNNLCSLVRSLVYGWLKSVSICALAALLAWCMLTALFVAIVSEGIPVSLEVLEVPALLGFIFWLFALVGTTVFVCGFLWYSVLEESLGIALDWVASKKSRPHQRTSSKENSIIYQWWKGMKDKTCILVTIK